MLESRLEHMDTEVCHSIGTFSLEDTISSYHTPVSHPTGHPFSAANSFPTHGGMMEPFALPSAYRLIGIMHVDWFKLVD